MTFDTAIYTATAIIATLALIANIVRDWDTVSPRLWRWLGLTQKQRVLVYAPSVQRDVRRGVARHALPETTCPAHRVYLLLAGLMAVQALVNGLAGFAFAALAEVAIAAGFAIAAKHERRKFGRRPKH